MKCAACHHDNQPSAKFCEECGAKLAGVCSSCGVELKSTAKFCPECGAQTVTAPGTNLALPYITDNASKDLAGSMESASTIAGERRQLTVLFCDMVGFTEISSRVDLEILQQIIRRYEDTCAVCVTRYEGYVYQRLGDGIVAFFGYPLAHEGEAERAIHAGLAIISALAQVEVPAVGRLQVRIGIASGLVVVTSVEKGAVGETMNLASRLQTSAQPGSVVVSDTVRRLAGGTFDYEALGEQILKGIPQPTRIYRVRGVSQVESRFEAATAVGLTPIVGREHEISMLLERWQLAQDGEGQVVLLSGEPGIGKSRIMSELLEKLDAARVQALRLQCSPYHINSAFYPTIDHLGRALKFGREESSTSKLDKLEALIVAHYALPLADVRFIATVLSIPCEERYGKLILTPQKSKDETLRTLVDLTEAAARKRPTVLLFEDAHWADPTSLEVLDQLIDRVRNIPLLIVLTHRPEFHARWSDHGHVTALNLSKLTRAQSSAIVAKLAGDKSLPPELLGQILAKTDGVPLYVEEMTRSILESGELKMIGDRYEYLGTAHTLNVPASLRDSLMARLDRSPAAKDIAQIGAAIGREFSYELIAAVAQKPIAELDFALEQLVGSGLAFRRGHLPEATYTFKHALVQDAAYDSLLKSARQNLHRGIARALEANFPRTVATEPELLAHHLTVAGDAEDAINYWQKAGTLAIKRQAMQEAVSHLNRGMVLVDSLPPSAARDAQELDLRTPLGMAWLALKGWSAREVWASLHPALSLAKSLGRHDALVPIYYGLWSVVLPSGRIAESLAWSLEMLETAEVTGHSDLLVVAHQLMCVTHFWLGNLLEARKHAERVKGSYREEHHRHLVDLMNIDPTSMVAVYDSASAWMLGHPNSATHINEANLASARRRNHPFDLGYVLSFGQLVLHFHADYAPILMRCEEAEHLSRAYSLPVISEVIAPLMKGLALVRAANIDEGVPHLQRTLDAWQNMGSAIAIPYWRTVQAEGLALSGDIVGGLHIIELSLAQIARPGWEERAYLAEILRLKGWMLERQGDFEGAEQNYQSSLTWAREQQAKSWELRTATSLARLWQGQGKPTEAHALLASIYDWFTEGFDTKDLKEAKALIEELSNVEHLES